MKRATLPFTLAELIFFLVLSCTSFAQQKEYTNPILAGFIPTPASAVRAVIFTWSVPPLLTFPAYGNTGGG